MAVETSAKYEAFRDGIEAFLLERGTAATWHEIKEALDLPQAVPYNGWVRAMEHDIGLQRGTLKGEVVWWIEARKPAAKTRRAKKTV